MKDRDLKSNIDYLLHLHQDVQQISKPIFKQYDINIMNFIRVKNDGTVMYLCDNYHWLKLYLDAGYPSLGAFENNFELRQSDHVLWSALSESDPIVIYSRLQFNINHGITLVFKNKEGHDFFNFGTSCAESAIKGTLINHREQLEKFTNHFYDKAHHLINKSNKHALNLMTFQKESTSTKAPLNRYHLGPAYDYQYLTASELKCLSLLVSNKSVLQIADALSVSARTIEKHIENIKQKLKCRTQCQIGYLVAKLGIDNSWDK